MIRIALIIGSTRPGRRAEAVARWAHDLASARDDATFENAIDYLYAEWQNKAAGFVSWGSAGRSARHSPTPARTPTRSSADAITSRPTHQESK